MATELRPEEVARVLRLDDQLRRQAFVESLQPAAEEWIIDVEGDAPLDTGRLRQSGHVEGLDVVFDAPYARAVEEGAPPHMVPLAALVEWAERHASTLGLSNVEKDAVRVAKAIQARIAAEGTPPRWFVKSKIDVLLSILDRMVRRRMAVLERGVR